MGPLFAATELVSPTVQQAFQALCSVGSLLITVYFWFVRMNREKVSVGVFPIGGFEGALHPDNLGVWSGRLYLANRSILPTAVVAVEAELWWKGRWQTGNCVPEEGSELPWNMPPTQVFVKTLRLVFDVGPDTVCDEVYANQRVRLTFVTVEGSRIVTQLDTNATAATGLKLAA